MSSANLTSLTNGLLAPWSALSSQPDPSQVPHTWNDPFPCPTCPGQPTHTFSISRGEYHDRVSRWVPGSVFCDITPGKSVAEPFVLIPGFGASTAAQVATRSESARSPSGNTTQCSVERLATEMRDALADIGYTKTLVNGPISVTFTDQQGATWSFFPRRYQAKSGTITMADGDKMIITNLPGCLLPATDLSAVPVEGNLHMFQKEEGGPSTLMSFDFLPSGSMQRIDIPPSGPIS